MNYHDPNAQHGQPWYPPTQPGQQWPSQQPPYPQPGQTYPPPYYAPPSPPMKPYSSRALYAFIGLYAFASIVFVMGQKVSQNLGASLWISIGISLLILDARGLARLQGLIKANGAKMVCLAILGFSLLPIWLGIYLARTFMAYHRPPLSLAPSRRKATVVFLACTGIMLFAFVSTSASVTPAPSTTSQVSSANTAITVPATATPTHASVAAKKPAPTRRPAQRAMSAPIAQPTPTPRPAAAPPAVPTSPPAPTYNTDPGGGSLVYSPPADFCDSNACVSTFWTATRGYVVECANGEYSHSGGVSGACSRDGGVAATLYEH